MRKKSNNSWSRIECTDCGKGCAAACLYLGRCDDCASRDNAHHYQNFTRSKYYKLKEKQRRVCGICDKASYLQIDHDHTTGVVRGLLCRNCNSLLGSCEDSISRLMRAVKYLEQAGTDHLAEKLKEYADYQSSSRAPGMKSA